MAPSPPPAPPTHDHRKYRVLHVGTAPSKIRKQDKNSGWQVTLKLGEVVILQQQPQRQGRAGVTEAAAAGDAAAVRTPPSSSSSGNTTISQIFLRGRTKECVELLQNRYAEARASGELVSYPSIQEQTLSGASRGRRSDDNNTPALLSETTCPPRAATLGSDVPGHYAGQKRSFSHDARWKAGSGRKSAKQKAEENYDNKDERSFRKNTRSKALTLRGELARKSESVKAHRERKRAEKWTKEQQVLRRGIDLLDAALKHNRWDDLLNASIGNSRGDDDDDRPPITFGTLSPSQAVELSKRATLLRRLMNDMFLSKKKPSVGRIATAVCRDMFPSPHPDTLEKWWRSFKRGGFKLTPMLKGRYERPWIFDDESLSMKAREFIMENAAPKGRPNMRVDDFQRFVNEDLLNSMKVEELHGLRAPISRECARQWLYRLGCKSKVISAGVYYDGHDREDVLDYRKNWLQRMQDAEKCMPLYLHFTLDEARSLLKTRDPKSGVTSELSRDVIQSALLPGGKWHQHDIPLLQFHVDDPTIDFSQYRMRYALGGEWNKLLDWESGGFPRLVHFVQDESIYKSYSSQKKAWFLENQRVIRKKGEGRGVMASGFVSEVAGMIVLTSSEVSTINKRRIEEGMYS